MRTRTFFACAALTLSALARPAFADEVQVSDTARQHFKTGVAYLTDPDGARYEEAYREFKAAYADSPSWKILGNLGITSLKLERDGEAVEAFEKYLAGGGQQIDPAERAQMERDLMTTKAGVAYVNLKVEPAGASLTDERQPLTGRSVTNRYDVAPDGTLRIGIRQGHHRLTAKLQGYEDQTWEFEAAPGAEQSHEFKLEPPKAAVVPPTTGGEGGGGTPVATHRPISTPVIIGAAATGALLAGSGVVGILAMGKKNDFNDKNNGTDVEAAKSAHDSANTLNIVGDALLGGAVVAGIVTVVLFVNRPEKPVTQDTGATARRFEVVPAVGANNAGVWMTGRF